jgi:hypothetical protein
MLLAPNIPTWEEVLRDPAPQRYEARPSRLGYCWTVVDLRDGSVRSSGISEAAAKKRAADLNRADL